MMEEEHGGKETHSSCVSGCVRMCESVKEVETKIGNIMEQSAGG